MGFFSAIKKFLGNDQKEEQKQDIAPEVSPETAPEVAPESDIAPEATVEATPESDEVIAEAQPQATPEVAPEAVAEPVIEEILVEQETAPEAITEPTTEAIIEPTPEVIAEPEAEVIIEQEATPEVTPQAEEPQEEESSAPVETFVETPVATPVETFGEPLEEAPEIHVVEESVEELSENVTETLVEKPSEESVEEKTDDDFFFDKDSPASIFEQVLQMSDMSAQEIESVLHKESSATIAPLITQPLAEPETAPQVPHQVVEEVTPQAEVVAPAAVQAPVASYSGLNSEDQATLSLALRTAEPRLSAWLAVVTEGIDTVSPVLWQRLLFLLESLEAKEEEAQAFVDDFAKWLTRMEYEYMEEFRSELQYRLALALELEDEEDERNRLFVKLSDGLARTREQFTRKLDALFASHGAFDAAFWEEIEELFIMADVGFESSMELIDRLKDGVRRQGLTQPQELRGVLQEELTKIFQIQRRTLSFKAPEVVMMIGVNGVGKTTTIAKLAHRDRMQGKKVLIAAADTFRAAATEQLGVWAARVGADFHSKNTGADPAAVAFEAMDLALRDGYDVLYVDTAGRLQTKVNLMEELTKIRNVIAKKHPGAPHRSILVVDATTGQNALSQTKLFKEAAGIDEIILSKLDGTAKGGVAISVAMQFQIPITYVGLGEKLEDLRPFNGKDFALALLGEAPASE